jgi:hypothetical protein
VAEHGSWGPPACSSHAAANSWYLFRRSGRAPSFGARPAFVIDSSTARIVPARLILRPALAVRATGLPARW